MTSNMDISSSQHHFTDEFIRSESDASTNMPSAISRIMEQFKLSEDAKLKAKDLYITLGKTSTIQSIQSTESDLSPEKIFYLCLSAVLIATNIEPHHPSTISVKSLQKTEKTLRLVELYDLLSSSITNLQMDNTPLDMLVHTAQKKLILLECHFNKYDRYFQEFFNMLTDDSKSDSFFATGWLFFILCASKNPEYLTDFETSYQLLFSACLFYWQNAYSERKIQNVPAEDVYKLFNLTPEQVDATIMSLPKSYIDSVVGLHDVPKAATYEALFSHNSTHEAFKKLVEMQAPLSAIDFDETYFLEKKASSTSSFAQISAPVYQLKSVRAASTSTAGTQFGCMSPLRSPSNAKHATIALTPMESTMYSIQCLQKVYIDEMASPSHPDLARFLTIDANLSKLVEDRASMLVASVTVLGSACTGSAAEYRRNLCKKIYYYTLRNMLIAEEKRLNQSSFVKFLQIDSFHKSLIACCIEVVLFSYNMKDKAEFTSLLQVFNIPAFEFGKIIESFVTSAEMILSSICVRHFRSIEERIFDSLVWKKDSLLYELLSKNEVTFATTKEAPAPARAIQMFSSPLRPQSTSTTLQVSTMTSTTTAPRSTSVDFFLRKIQQIVNTRIQDLCEHLNSAEITKDHHTQILNSVMYILTKERNLMVNRHVDHVIMCSIYVICNKVNKIKLHTPAFKDIIREYRSICENHRQLSPIEICKVLWQVPLDDSSHGDIVKFYNHVFIPAVKSFILQLPNTVTLNLPFQVNSIMSPARKRVPTKGNVFLSPMRKQGTNPATPNSQASLTPRGRALYAFGEHHSTKIEQQQQQDVSPKGQTPKRPLKRSLFPEDSADEPAKKRAKLSQDSEDSAEEDDE